MNCTTNPQHSQTHKKTLNFRLKYKTEKCRYLLEKGYCPFSSNCTFAHFDYEIRDKHDVPPKYKTKPCINFGLKGFCNYGERCQYLHIVTDLQDRTPTRSSSEESTSSNNSRKTKSVNHLWDHMSHNKRVELIQNLGLDFAIRKSSRLIQLLNSNQKESDYSTDQETQIENYQPYQRKQKKYSM